MRIAVIGAGLAGVTTAYELTRDGHEVTVFERRGSIAAEGSFAPSSVVAPGLWLAHAAAGAWGGLEHLSAGPRRWPWLWRRWRTGRQPASAARRQCMRDLAQLTQERLRAVEASHQLDYEHHRGVLALLRTARHAQRAQALLATIEPGGLPVQWLSAEQARAAEPGLNPSLPLEGALCWPQGETANGRQFAHALKAEAQRLGARFQFQLEVSALAASGTRRGLVELQTTRRRDLGDSSLANSATGATTVVDEEPQAFDAVAICTAEGATRLLAGRGVKLPWAMGHVHSVTASLRAPIEPGDAFGPVGALVDPAASITISRMGERLRVAGGAALGGQPTGPRMPTLARLYRALDDCFPGAARTARTQPWVGRQVAFADGLPALGASGVAGVWLNLGHGANRWAWAGATARLLADQISGRPAQFDMTLLAPARLR